MSRLAKFGGQAHRMVRAVEAGFRVGYDDAAHFNREYKRHFGKPPMRDVEGLRELSGHTAQ